MNITNEEAAKDNSLLPEADVIVASRGRAQTPSVEWMGRVYVFLAVSSDVKECAFCVCVCVCASVPEKSLGVFSLFALLWETVLGGKGYFCVCSLSLSAVLTPATVDRGEAEAAGLRFAMVNGGRSAWWECNHRYSGVHRYRAVAQSLWSVFRKTPQNFSKSPH